MTRRAVSIPFEASGVVARRSKALAEQAKAGGKCGGVRRCTKCLLPETEETVFFDADGVCNVCAVATERDDEVDWDARQRDFEEIIERHRGRRQYDAIVPFSGGKDSSWTAYVLVKRFGLNILLVTFDSHFRRPIHLQNVERVVRALGCEHVTFRAKDDVIRKTMLESLKRKGDFCWFCHTGVVAAPYKAAIMYNVPLIIWGEPGSEHSGGYYDYKTMTPAGERWFNRLINLSINAEDMFGFIEGVEMRDLEPFRLPPEEEIKRLDAESIHLGDYFKWDAPGQYVIINRELGWQMAEVENLHPRYHYEKVECFLQGTRDYLRFIKRGYSRTAQRANIDIRNGVLTRDEAKRMIHYDAQRPGSLEVIIEYLGISEDEFNDIALSHQIYPHVHDPAAVRPAQKKLDDHDLWAEHLVRPKPQDDE